MAKLLVAALALLPQLLLAEPTEKQKVICLAEYKVRHGDTCMAIASYAKVPLYEFQSLNPDVDCSKPLGKIVVVCTKAADPTTTVVQKLPTKTPTHKPKGPMTKSRKTWTHTTAPHVGAETPSSVNGTYHHTKFTKPIKPTESHDMTIMTSTPKATTTQVPDVWTHTRTGPNGTVITGTPSATLKPSGTTTRSTHIPWTTFVRGDKEKRGAPQPLQPGTSSHCSKYHFVCAGDTCGKLESQYGISAGKFQSLNPSINHDCTNLWLGYYVCVGGGGGGGGGGGHHPPPDHHHNAPSPLMPNVVGNCKRYCLVKDGDTCNSMERASGISDGQFHQWNPYVDGQCSNLWKGYYVCIGA